jgi:hypothetical protein
MLKKFTLTITACLLFITAINMRTMAQSKRDLIARFFVNLPRQTPFRDKTQLPFFFHKPFRTYDGTGNNISGRTTWDYGARILRFSVKYQLSTTLQTRIMQWEKNRPSPREISNVLVDEPVTHFNERN